MQIAKISLLLICLNLERFIHLKKEYVFALLSGAFVSFRFKLVAPPRELGRTNFYYLSFQLSSFFTVFPKYPVILQESESCEATHLL